MSRSLLQLANQIAVWRPFSSFSGSLLKLGPCTSSTVNFDVSKRYGFPRGTKPKPHLKYDWEAVEEMTGGKYTHKPLNIPRLGGRDKVTKRKVSKHIGGGVKFDYFLVDFHRRGPTGPGEFYEERVLEVRKDPNRTPYIALVAGRKGKRWLLATENMEAGQIIKSTQHIPELLIKPQEANAYPCGSLPPGTIVNCIEREPGTGAKDMINAGAAATVTLQEKDGTVIQYPNKHSFKFNRNCMVTVGRLSNTNWKNMIWGSGNMKRRFGWKQSSGLWQRKNCYQGRKLHPIPPVKLSEVKDEKFETRKLTLTWREWTGRFGVAVTDPIRVGNAPYDHEYAIEDNNNS